MKKSGKKLAIAAVLAGSVMAVSAACQNNVAVYGPPPEDISHEGDSNEGSTEYSEVYEIDDNENSESYASQDDAYEDYDPDDNMNVEVYGPPEDFDTDEEWPEID